MSYIAFDTSKRSTGYAYRNSEGLWVTGIVKPADTKALRSVVREAVAQGIDAASIEDCYLGTSRNVKTIKALQDAQTRIRVACEIAELTVELVYPTTWQASFGITGKSRDRKLGAQRVASLLDAPEGISEDEVDAVCLCEFARWRRKQRERIGKGSNKAV